MDPHFDDSVIRTILETRAIEPEVFFNLYRDWKRSPAPPQSLASFLVEGGYLSTHDVERFASERPDGETELASPHGSVNHAVASTAGPGKAEAQDTTQNFDPAATADSTFSLHDVGLPPLGLARFEKREFVARGGHGEVWKAYDHELKRHVAWKQVRAEFLERGELRLRLIREATNMAALDHPGIVPVYGLGVQEDGTPFYTMRFVEGKNLVDELNTFHGNDAESAWPSHVERRLRLRDFLTRFIAVCNTMQYAHDRKTLHRDLKPENIRIGPLGETLVMDWGLTKHVLTLESVKLETGELPSTLDDATADRGITDPRSLLGTYGYISPEAARSEHHRVSHCTDIWGLGCILYAILAGGSPYQGKPFAAFILAAKKGEILEEPLRSPRIAPALASIALKALRAEPEDRYPSAQALAQDVERWLADEAVSSHQDSPIVRVGRFTRRHRSAVVAGLAILLTAIPILSLYNYWLATTNKELERSYRAFYAVHEPTSRQLANVFFATARQLRIEFPGTDEIVYKMYDTGVDISRKLAENAPAERRHVSQLALADVLIDQGAFVNLLKGLTHRSEAPMREAIDIGERELQTAVESDELRYQLASWYLTRAEARNYRENLAEAALDYDKALWHCNARREAVWPERRAEVLEARVKYNKASFLVKLEQFKSALELATDSRLTLERLAPQAQPQEGVQRWLVQADKIQGIVYLNMKRFADANGSFVAALQHAEKLESHIPDRDYLIADVNHWLGRVHHSMGALDQAVEMLTTTEKLMLQERDGPRKLKLNRGDDLLARTLCYRGLSRVDRHRDAVDVENGCKDAEAGLALLLDEKKRTGGNIDVDKVEVTTCQGLADHFRACQDAERETKFQARAQKARTSLADRRKKLAAITKPKTDGRTIDGSPVP